MTDLLPCPFCESPGAICCLEDEPGSPASFWVNCSCGIETRERRTEAEAISLWNTRPAQRLPMQADIAQIVDAGWKSGKSSADVAAEILREFEA